MQERLRRSFANGHILTKEALKEEKILQFVRNGTGLGYQDQNQTGHFSRTMIEIKIMVTLTFMEIIPVMTEVAMPVASLIV